MNIRTDVQTINGKKLVRGFVDDKLVYTSKLMRGEGYNNASHIAGIRRRWERRIVKQIKGGRKV